MKQSIVRHLDGATTRVHRALSPRARRLWADLVARSAEEVTYGRLIERGFRPDGIIDVGAFDGDWTRMTQRLFGPTPALMVEAQEGKRQVLELLTREKPHVRLALSPLSGKSGERITFFEMGTGSSFMAEASNAPRTERRLTTRTLDEVAAEALPDARELFLKIDVQGAELHVLDGGAATLERCAAVQLETALLQYNQGAPLLPVVTNYMAERGFLPFEVSGFSRPRDVLVQIDLLFARPGTMLRPDRFVF
ncbi:FkbM family methyltransferase [Sphingomonas sp. BE138]|uniref:FkbM family methyltransferase n=1 Tax=Sphingomonas sp. BE138 TaxID=2817845 RepID=UPI0028585CC9|nr:FkbM family methyltransferase [Sphingomonas sp. BE138]MDR6786894.1 FkbM family methyltransferase [Sphingomonas sp. BE138]